MNGVGGSDQGGGRLPKRKDDKCGGGGGREGARQANPAGKEKGRGLEEGRRVKAKGMRVGRTNYDPVTPTPHPRGGRGGFGGFWGGGGVFANTVYHSFPFQLSISFQASRIKVFDIIHPSSFIPGIDCVLFVCLFVCFFCFFPSIVITPRGKSWKSSKSQVTHPLGSSPPFDYPKVADHARH